VQCLTRHYYTNLQDDKSYATADSLTLQIDTVAMLVLYVKKYKEFYDRSSVSTSYTGDISQKFLNCFRKKKDKPDVERRTCPTLWTKQTGHNSSEFPVNVWQILNPRSWGLKMNGTGVCSPHNPGGMITNHWNVISCRWFRGSLSSLLAHVSTSEVPMDVKMDHITFL
jgi:hypothetical protein